MFVTVMLFCINFISFYMVDIVATSYFGTKYAINETTKMFSSDINNINIENINLNSLRSNIGYVSQDAILFNKTIKDNIVLGKTLNLDKLNKILKICELEGLIFKLPNHLETRLQESGNNLSGGEIERIILARSLYDLKPIMIFDEALSQVDIATEKKIIKNILGAYKNCTLIYISHKDVQDLFKKQIKLF